MHRFVALPLAVLLVGAVATAAGADATPPNTNTTYQPTNAEWLARYEDGQQPVDTVLGGPTNPTGSIVRTPAGVVEPGQLLTFDASASHARHGRLYGGTAIVNWIWDFGDGIQANSQVAHHAYGSPGIYHVTLTVHDDTGWRAQREHVVQVGADPTQFVDQELSIPTADGVVLHGWVSRPDGPGPFPTILIYGPYGTGPVGRGLGDVYGDFVRNGYAFAQVAAPGRELSTGHFDLFGAKTQKGGYDAVEYLAGQPWSDGKVGLWGLSGPACGAMLTAAARPPHLATVVAKSCYADLYRDMAVAGGVPNTNTFIDTWLPALLAQDEGPLQSSGRTAEIPDRAVDDAQLRADIAAHPMFDAWWQERSIVDYPSPTAPVLYYGNERDLWPRASVEYSHWIAPAGGHEILIPGGHTFADVSGWAAGKNAFDFLEGESRLWFDRYLKGTSNGVEHHPAVVSFDAHGGDAAAAFDFGRWQAADGLPSSSSRARQLFLHAASTNAERPTYHGLSAEPPAAGELPGVLAYSPAQGATSDDTSATLPLIAGTQESWESQSLVYETPPMTDELHVDGPATLSFYADVVGPDLAFTVHLNDVWPDGSSHYVSKGVLLASHRALDTTRSLYLGSGAGRVLIRPYHPHTAEAVQQTLPGTTYRFDVEIWGVHNIFTTGHRLRVALAAQDLGWRTHTEPGPGAVVLSDAAHPSVLNLAEVPASSSRAPFPYDHLFTEADGAMWATDPGAPGSDVPEVPYPLLLPVLGLLLLAGVAWRRRA
jgi:putative CocE/NonD family hydrolase